MSNTRIPGPMGLSRYLDKGPRGLLMRGPMPAPAPAGSGSGPDPHAVSPPENALPATGGASEGRDADARDRPLLSFGSRGPLVSELQTRLNKRGASPRLAVDGIFGPKTRAAVIAFQRSSTIRIDGIVGPQTWSRLLREDHSGASTGGGSGSAPSKPAAPPPPAPKPKAQAEPDKVRRLTEIHWIEKETYCGGPATLAGATVNYSDGDTEDAQVLIAKGGPKVATAGLKIKGNAFSQKVDAKDWLPRRIGGNFEEARDQDAEAAGQKTPDPLKVKFIPTLATAECTIGISHFHMQVKNYDCQVEGKITYVPGFMAWLIQLGSHVNDAPGVLRVLLPNRLLNALFAPGGQAGVNWGAEEAESFSGADWRFAKEDVSSPSGLVYWDGKKWRDVPDTWQDTNNVKKYGIGIWREGSANKAQFGNAWPEDIPTWSDENKNLAKTTFAAWVSNTKSAWSGKFDLRRDACASSNTGCCRYAVSVAASFTEVGKREGHTIVVGANNGRSNAGAWSLGDSRPGLAPHEFGHHLGAPDEYPGGVGIDESVNDDGATKGIDPSSLMGSVPAAGIPPIKARHLKVVSQHLTAMIKAEKGVDWPMMTVAHT